MQNLDNWPRIIQLAWLLTDEYGAEVKRGKYLIHPDGWVMPTDKFWTDNGFSQENSIKRGFPIGIVLDLFLGSLDVCDLLVSHNMSFDYHVLGAELLRSRRKIKKTNKLCTKEIGANFCKIKTQYSNYKWPKLIELHQKLFNKGFDGAHDAMSDVIACKDCFFELCRLGVINVHPEEDLLGEMEEDLLG